MFTIRFRVVGFRGVGFGVVGFRGSGRFQVQTAQTETETSSACPPRPASLEGAVRGWGPVPGPSAVALQRVAFQGVVNQV